MASRIRYFSMTGLPPGLLTGILLGIVQSMLVALLPVDVSTGFVLLIILIPLLYLLVPFFVLLHAMRQKDPIPGANRVAGRIGRTCASLVILSTLITYTLSLVGVQEVQAGGFFGGLRLIGDSFLSLTAIILLSLIGLLLALIGGWLGGALGAWWR
jgi:hypothetical protein